ncbi:beta-galactosidase [Leifsonia flava]|uniref:Beta-galactosidase n=1 Tax=Orlajensenia leifsoniae TaxID=2561933 RepID=A0A4Y9R6F2_9MICO|nr:beta-galactosidase [Leifsonia flava]TFV99920.1 beta-galactosidase [Leifsonia flava]
MVLWYGGDYNPEQWTSDVWDQDVTLMRRAGVTVATVGVFSWAQLEPRDGVFEFGWLDDIIDRLHAGGIRVDLATATASPPAWLSAAHPEILPVTRDGVTLWPGSRQHYSPSSPVYRRYAARLVRKLAERYGSHPALIAWHIGNEFGNDNPRDYSDVAAAAFRRWLRSKYTTIDALNSEWGTAFWSQRYDSFEEILPPRSTPTFGNPAHLLDFERFSSDEHIACYVAELEILREYTPDIPVTTNFMGFFGPADYWKWAELVDFVCDDAYPDPGAYDSYIQSGMQRDLMRSLGHGKPWILMEQATSAVNWRAVNTPKAAGQMRATSYQALARGADGIMFFQWRQSIHGAEKFHSAMVPAQGTDHRIWREVEAFGNELPLLAQLEGTPVEGVKVAIVFNWDSWWSLDQKALPAETDYIAGLTAWYTALFNRGIVTDFAAPGADLSGYDLVIAPSLFCASESELQNLADYAETGTLLVTYLTGITDETTRLTPSGYLGPLAATLGIQIDEFSPRATHRADEPRRISGGVQGNYGVWSEIITAKTAEVVARFDDGTASGHPAVTRRPTTSGTAWYSAAELDRTAISDLLGRVIEDTDVEPEFLENAPGVEVVRRGGLVFAINHGRTTATVTVESVAMVLEPYEVVLIEAPEEAGDLLQRGPRHLPVRAR